MNEDVEKIWGLFASLYPSLEEQIAVLRDVPQLAHYTSITVLEKILATNEIWFSNPLFMNDLEEVKFGIVQGTSLLRSSEDLLLSLGSDQRRGKFTFALDHYFSIFDAQHAFDTYVFCLSKHNPQQADGRLSMWRGYGGNGRGAAIIFDTTKIALLSDTPLIFSKVNYGSADDRLNWVRKLGKDISGIVSANSIPDDMVYLVAQAAFERLKLFALFTKHVGFAEEEEWRVAYMPDRDPNGLLKPMLGYNSGPKGIEPKLKLQIAPLQGAIPEGITLDNLVSQILLGPTASSTLAQRSVERMFDLIKRPEFKDRLRASTIPLRDT